MKLNKTDIVENRSEWLEKGYQLPEFDREAMVAKSKAEPTWIHFGAGNIFRAFQANDLQNILNSGAYDRGVIAAGGRDSSIIDKMYRLHDDLSLLVTLKAGGKADKIVVGSVSESVCVDFHREEDYKRLCEIFQADSLQIASLTITEKGYAIRDAEKQLFPDVASDLEHGPQDPESYMGKITALLYVRYLSGRKKIAVLSMDNCFHNGDTLKAAVTAFADAWTEKGLAPKGEGMDQSFAEYVKDGSLVSFPCSMIDKITPRPDPQIESMLKADGIEDIAPVITERKTYVAPFVNAEEPEYLVVEDDFPNGRPPLEKGGVIFTDRATVDKSERMKVCTCLNPLHTSLAIFGSLLGCEKMSEAIGDPDLRKLVEGVGYKEGLPVVTNPGILDPKEFIDTVVNVRIPNPYLPDTPQRIMTDTSQKVPIRFGETIKAYQQSAEHSTEELKLIPLVFAGWLRYILGVDDNGKEMERSADPALPKIDPYLQGIRLGDTVDAEGRLHDLLANSKIFGVNLYEAGLADKVKADFLEMIKGPGAVRTTLHRMVS